MSRHWTCSLAAMVSVLIGLFGPINASGHKTSELNQKMTEISSLQNSLNEKITLAVKKKDQLTQKTEELKKEIKEQNAQLNLESYLVAVQNPRIDYNLKLIQLLLGYISRLNEKIVYFKNGHETLTFFFQQAQDDLLMIKTLNDLEIDKLIAQINEVLDEYIAETGKPMFDVNEVPLKDTEKIWNEIIQNSKQMQ
jgi:uncharacterized membrane protein YheB (UPF0754 family)